MSQSSYGPEQSGTAGTYGSGTGNLPPTRRRGRQRLLGIIIGLPAILLIILALIFFPRPTAVVTLTPVSKTLNNSATVSIAARPLSSTQQSSQTGVPSGPPQRGTYATGTLKFLNYTSSWVTIPAGTTVTDVTNQRIVTDKAIRVPPDPIIPGVAFVSAHAAKVGKSGNIAALGINKSCCFAGIYVLNESAYSGGRDGQKDPMVQQSDLDTVANSLKTSLTQKAMVAIQSQFKPGEQLVDTAPACTAKVVSQPGVGTSIANFTVNVSLLCSALAYNPQTALQQAGDTLKQKAAQQLDPGFIPVGNIVTRIEKVTQGESGNVNALVFANGTWKYQFTQARKLDIAKHIARTTVSDAKTWLLQQTGVAKVAISISGPIIDLSRGNTVPDDLRAIPING
jgi:hypothetical protein